MAKRRYYQIQSSGLNHMALTAPVRKTILPGPRPLEQRVQAIVSKYFHMQQSETQDKNIPTQMMHIPPYLALAPNPRRATFESALGFTLCALGILAVNLTDGAPWAYVVGLLALLGGFALFTAADIRRNGVTYPYSKLQTTGASVLRLAFAVYTLFRRRVKR
jgi:hypothetical protein